jgi:amidase
MSEELAYLSAREAVERFAARRLSPVELMRALLARATRLAPAFNATTAIHAEEALVQARQAEARYRAGTQRPLEGVPVAIKEETAVAGWRRTIGSWLHEELSPAHPRSSTSWCARARSRTCRRRTPSSA